MFRRTLQAMPIKLTKKFRLGFDLKYYMQLQGTDRKI